MQVLDGKLISTSSGTFLLSHDMEKKITKLHVTKLWEGDYKTVNRIVTTKVSSTSFFQGAGCPRGLSSGIGSDSQSLVASVSMEDRQSLYR